MTVSAGTGRRAILKEFDFRYNNRVALGIDDTVSAERALKGIKGKRLTYRVGS